MNLQKIIGLFLSIVAGAIEVQAQLSFNVLKPEVVEQRLQGYKGTDTQRESTLKHFFEEAGCIDDKLVEQPVKGLRQPNIICELPGSTDSVIVVGAHYDHVDRGKGVVDNWSGASLLPSLFQSLKQSPRKYTFRFISFAGEENGLVGSRFYAKNLKPEEAKKIIAMVCVDTLALGPTEVWVSRSDPGLVHALARTATAIHAPLSGMNVEKVGESDEEAFIPLKIPTITVHSLTQETLHILHSDKDNYAAVHFEDYFQSYRLLTAYLVFLDQETGLHSSGQK